MDRIIFGDNQFFAINHMSEEKARQQAIRFKDTDAIIATLDFVYGLGIRTFMCTTHDRISSICDHLRAHPDQYKGFKIYPCMPYAHKYNNAVAEFGAIGALKRMLPGNVVSTMAKGGVALARKDYISLMKLAIDAEMKMFQGIETSVIFLQNIFTDLILGLGMTDLFKTFSDYIEENYNAEAGFITMNLPFLLQELENCGIANPIVCASINKIGFRMPGGTLNYESTISSKQCRLIAMQTLAAGAIPPNEAMEYVCRLKGIHSILYGASTKGNIEQTRDLIQNLSN
jgi:hypothetical protein